MKASGSRWTTCSSNASTPAELKRAKDPILNSFIFHFDTPEKVLREKKPYEFYHYPLDFLEQYRSRVEKVTADDVSRVAKKYLHKESLAVLVVGNAEEFGTPLSKLGQVNDVDITIPPPPASLMGEASARERIEERGALLTIVHTPVSSS